MRCQFCNNPAGFMKTYHVDCKEKTEKCILEIGHLVNEYNCKNICFTETKQRIIDLVSSNVFYENYLQNQIRFDFKDIRKNEKLIHIENMVSIFESKKRKTMERTGLSYARYPRWEVSSRMIGELSKVAFTDKCIYLICPDGTIIYPYSKIVNIGYDFGYAYFDVKTTSPYPHRFEIKATNSKESSKAENIVLFLNLLCDWNNS